MSDDERTRGSGQGDDLAKLIREAGRRRPIPADRAARVKAALHDRWQQDLRRRRRVRYGWGLAVLSAATLILIVRVPGLLPGTGAPPAAAGPVGSVVMVEGAAIVEEAGSAAARPLRLHDALPAGASLETAEGGRLALRLTTGHSMRLDAGSRVLLPAPGAVRLDRGALYVDSGSPGGAGRALTVRTPLGTVEEKGTQFEVRLSAGSMRVRVREGKVAVDDGRELREILSMSEIVVSPGAPAVVQPIPSHGPDWSWVTELAVVPDLEGLSAQAFLDWIARERGLKLSFSSEELARSSAGILLSGSIRKLSLEEALDAVLPTCGLRYRVEDGTLIVEPSGARS